MIRTALQIIGALSVAAFASSAVYVAKNTEAEEFKELKQATEFFRNVEFKIKPQRKVEEEC